MLRSRQQLQANAPWTEMINSSCTHVLIHNELLPKSADECEEFGRALGKSRDLKIIRFGPGTHDKRNGVGDPISTPECAEALCRGLANNRSIEEIYFSKGCHLFFRGRALQLLIPFFETNDKLKKLEIDPGAFLETNLEIISNFLFSCKSLTAVKLMPSHKPLFGVQAERLNTVKMSRILQALAGMQHLQAVELGGGDVIDPMDENINGTLACMLKNPKTELKELTVHWSLTDDWMVSFANALKKNQTLQTFKSPRKQRLTSRGWTAMKNSLRYYNHTLQSIDCWGFPMPILHLLKVNENHEGESSRLRKELDFNFLLPGKQFNGEPFGEEFDIRLLPHVLHSIAVKRNMFDKRSQTYRISALHHFVQCMPLLVVEPAKRVDSKINNL